MILNPLRLGSLRWIDQRSCAVDPTINNEDIAGNPVILKRLHRRPTFHLP